VQQTAVLAGALGHHLLEAGFFSRLTIGPEYVADKFLQNFVSHMD
jgi:hypothetical protein